MQAPTTIISRKSSARTKAFPSAAKPFAVSCARKASARPENTAPPLIVSAVYVPSAKANSVYYRDARLQATNACGELYLYLVIRLKNSHCYSHGELQKVYNRAQSGRQRC